MSLKSSTLKKLVGIGIDTASKLAELDGLIKDGNSFQGALIIMLSNRKVI